MFGRIMRFIRFLRSYSYYSNLTIGPVIPIKTNLGVNNVLLNADGTIEGDFDGCEHWLKSVEVRTGPEDRIIFWLLLQYWRQRKEMETLLMDMRDAPFANTVYLNKSSDDPMYPANSHPVYELIPPGSNIGEVVYTDAGELCHQIPTVKPTIIPMPPPKQLAITKKLDFEHI